jgi:hypothetical protein
LYHYRLILAKQLVLFIPDRINHITTNWRNNPHLTNIKVRRPEKIEYYHLHLRIYQYSFRSTWVDANFSRRGLDPSVM